MVQFEEVKDKPGPEANGYEEGPTWEDLFAAPSYTQLIKPAQSRNAKEYQDKVYACLKAVMAGAINAGDLPDAAAILAYGPAFGSAAGQFADNSEWAARTIDMLTTPGNPAVMFLMTAIPLIGQLARNHEAELKAAPGAIKQGRAERRAQREAQGQRQPRFTIRIFKKHIPVYWSPKPSRLFGMFRSQTQDPKELTIAVFSDPNVQRALQKQGFRLVKTDAPA
jgi:hypothetical protein